MKQMINQVDRDISELDNVIGTMLELRRTILQPERSAALINQIKTAVSKGVITFAMLKTDEAELAMIQFRNTRMQVEVNLNILKMKKVTPVMAQKMAANIKSAINQGALTWDNLVLNEQQLEELVLAHS